MADIIACPEDRMVDDVHIEPGVHLLEFEFIFKLFCNDQEVHIGLQMSCSHTVFPSDQFREFLMKLVDGR